MRLFATAVVVIGLAAAESPCAVGQDSGRFPSKPVTLIVPWPAGGSTDIAMRAMSEVAAKHLGQPIIVDNRAGASGTLGPAHHGCQRQAGRLHDLRRFRSRSSAVP